MKQFSFKISHCSIIQRDIVTGLGRLQAWSFCLFSLVKTRGGAAVDGGCRAVVCVPRVEVAGLSDAGLRGRLGVLGEADSQLEALKAQTMAEMARRHDTAGAKKMAREVLRSSPSKAHHDVKAAERLAGLAATSEALAAGEVPPDVVGTAAALC